MGRSPAFSSFAVSGLDEARTFSREVLGLAVTDLADAGLLQLDIADGRPTMVYPKPDHAPGDVPRLNLPVDDVTAAVRELTDRGVTMERYAGFEQDELGISPGAGTSYRLVHRPRRQHLGGSRGLAGVSRRDSGPRSR